MASVVFRGKAAVEGVAGTFDIITYPLQQTGKMTVNAEEEIIKDVHGFDTAWLNRNQHVLADWMFKLLGDTAAHAAAGGVVVAPLAIVTLSGFTLSFLNTTWQNVSGQSIDLANVKVGDFGLKLRAYSDSGQNTSAATTPS